MRLRKSITKMKYYNQQKRLQRHSAAPQLSVLLWASYVFHVSKNNTLSQGGFLSSLKSLKVLILPVAAGSCATVKIIQLHPCEACGGL